MFSLNNLSQNYDIKITNNNKITLIIDIGEGVSFDSMSILSGEKTTNGNNRFKFGVYAGSELNKFELISIFDPNSMNNVGKINIVKTITKLNNGPPML